MPPGSPQSADVPVSRFDVAVETYASSPVARHRLYRRTLAAVVFSQVFGGAGLAAGVTVGALLAQDMLRSDSLTGIPSALFTFGSAGAAFLVGRLSQRSGRRVGLAAGFVAGGIGAAGVVLAAVADNIVLLFASLLVYGSGTATNLQARYAGTDLAPVQQRGRAVSIAMVSTTLGAVLGPNLIGVLGTVATSLGIPALAGPFLLASVAYTLAGIVLLILLRPDPLLVSRAVADRYGQADPVPRTDARARAGSRGVFIGGTVMVLTQIAMVAIMTMTPIQMRQHAHELREIGLVIGVHIGAMYLPSLVTGALVDKIGRIPIAIASGVTLLAAGIVAAAAPTDSVGILVLALALLGLGWNFGVISGTALIVDYAPASTRAKTQGTVDLVIAIAGASGGALSGMVVAASSYATLALAGGFLALLLIPVVAWSRRATDPPASIRSDL